MPLEGSNLWLREERIEDQPFLLALRNDLDTQAWSKALPPAYTLPMYEKRFNAREFSYNPESANFIIEMKESRQFAGYIAYSGLRSRLEATLGIMVEKVFWGTGVALEASEVLLQFLFHQLGLRVVRLWTHSGNPRAVGLAQKSGFKVSVRQRERIYLGGQLLDNLSMDLLREEYYARHLELEDWLPPVGLPANSISRPSLSLRLPDEN